MNATSSSEQNRGVVSQYAEMWRQGMERYLGLARRFAQPDADATLLDLAKLHQRYVDFAWNEGFVVYRKISELCTNYYTAVLNNGVNVSRECYQRAYQTNADARAPLEPTGSAMRELVFTGPIGSTASRAFVVSNRTDNPAKVSFELSEFVKENGPEKVRVDVQLTPRSLQLPGRGERTVDCSLPFTRAFEPGAEYRAVLRVIGFPDMKIGLVVRAEKAPRAKKPVSAVVAPQTEKHKS